MNELNVVRGLLTLVLMLSFIILVVWLYARRHRDAYEAAARLPLEDDAAVSVKASAGDHTS